MLMCEVNIENPVLTQFFLFVAKACLVVEPRSQVRVHTQAGWDKGFLCYYSKPIGGNFKKTQSTEKIQNAAGQASEIMRGFINNGIKRQEASIYGKRTIIDHTNGK